MTRFGEYPSAGGWLATVDALSQDPQIVAVVERRGLTMDVVLAVAYAVADAADPTGLVTESPGQLAVRAGLPRRIVARTLVGLGSAGLLSRVAPPSAQGHSHHQLHLPAHASDAGIWP